MKRFITRLILYFILFLTALVSLFTFLEFIVENNSDFTITAPEEEKVKYAVFGHSHPRNAFNDSLIKNFANVAFAGESYFYTYFKVKKFVEQNPSLECLFIEFTNNQIDENKMDEWTWGSGPLHYQYPIYAPFMSNAEKQLLLENNFEDFWIATPLALKTYLNRALEYNFSYTKDVGGFRAMHRNKIDSLLVALKENKNTIEHSPIAEFNLKYLDKIIAYAKQQEKKVVLIRCPQHKMYPGFSNEKSYQDILEKRFSNVDYLDFTNFKLENIQFSDFEHINGDGAKPFSIWFNMLLEKGLLKKKNKQEFIDFHTIKRVKRGF